MKENVLAHWQFNDYRDFRKCGGILVSGDNEMTTFGLNCRFCPVVCMQFENFIRHVREQHTPDIQALQQAQWHEEDIAGKEQCTQTTQTDVADCCWRCVSSGAGAGDAADNEIDSDFDWNEITAMLNEDGIIVTSPAPTPAMDTTTNTTTTTITNGSATVAVAPTEEVGLVYIMEESGGPGEILMEEETVDSYEMFRGGNGSGGGGGCDGHPAIQTDRVIDEAIRSACDDGEDSFSSQKSIDSPQSAASTPSSTTSNGHTRRRESKEKYKKTPAMRAATKNKEIIAYLIGAYRTHEKLWNPNHPEYKYNANRQMYNELAGPLQHDMKCSLSGIEIFGIITELRGRYRRELTKTKERKGAYKTKLWYYEKMEFLRNLIEDKRAVRKAKHMDSDASECKQLERREIQTYLLDAYKRREVLWNPQHMEFQHCNSQQQYDDIALCLQEDLNVELTGTECHAEIKRLRTCYRKELGFLAKRKGLHVPKLWCFEQMEFLRPVLDEEMNKRQNKINSESRSRMKFLKAEAIPLGSIEEQLRFIEIYKGYTSLWDVDHPDYRASTYRTKSLNQMLEQVNGELNAQYNVDQLEKTLYQLRKEYSADKEKSLTGNGTAGVMAAVLYEKLREFLDLNLGPFRCELCHILLKTSDQFKIHRSGHDGSKPFKCTLCGKGFQIPGNLTIHIRRHKRDYPYACELCAKRFPTTSELTIHMRSHTGERPYICDLCGKSFKTWSFFDIHRRAHLNQSPFHCPICDKGFYERNRFTDHMNIHLNIRKHSCSECHKSFTTYANLRKHSELHLPVKKYNCRICSRGFSQFASLRWHMRTAHKEANANPSAQRDSSGERERQHNSIEH